MQHTELPKTTRRTARPHPQASHLGFTLIEVLVAISVMALMALMSWRGLEGMLRSQGQLQSRADNLRTLQAGLAQWQTDLDQVAELSNTPGWDWDGKVLRLTRHSPASPNGSATASVQVVAWTWRNDPGRPGGGDWQRWQSSPLTDRQSWQNAWAQAQQWSQTPDESTRVGQVQIHPLAGWQLFVHRGGSWINPLSSAVVNPDSNADIAPAPNPNTTAASGTLPDGVRLILTLPAGPVGSGPLQMDWARPTLTGAPA